MEKINKLKIFSDPIYGFITLPNTLIYDIVQHPEFQRLRRISQMGMAYMVFPGAHHTRFHHALGCLHLMQQAVNTLRIKGVRISDDEENGLYLAILLHDIGHGPFSHALEHSIIEEVSHEDISLAFMEKFNIIFPGKLDLAIEIFKASYPRKFMIQLVSSQLDMDRMDYLKRDSFFTGVAEGNISSQRMIQMMNVKDDVLVIEEKGIYSVENFLTARRLMYWQVYLHKTSLVTELILIKVMKRARELIQNKIEVNCSAPLSFFLNHNVSKEELCGDALDTFALLDDYDIISAVKQWLTHDDFILRKLSNMIINRELPKIILSNDKFSSEETQKLVDRFLETNKLTATEAKYFIFKGKIKNQAYNKCLEPIRILKKDGSVEDVIDASDQLNLRALSKPVTKYYICFPKVLVEK
ncbi:HD domain-containing protein [Flavobacterium ardleyense]|uniref:HD domain-containing protein n=1 Tax=Flavobacterium ardleyense TaxID=2038737 RepID=UPI00298C83C5|nr:HD domain-containing protein [Flavobacterium ardleyense]